VVVEVRDDRGRDLLTGRVAVVTGVSRRAGIGFAIAWELLAVGAKVLAQSWIPHDAEQPWGVIPPAYQGCWRRSAAWVTVWKHGHVTEPTRLPAQQAAGFWLETLQAGAAIDRYLRPVKMNHLTLGNTLPHLHTHNVPRHADDPLPGRPLSFDYLDAGRQPEGRLQADAQALRAALAERPSVGDRTTTRSHSQLNKASGVAGNVAHPGSECGR
jgi:diadenosine tetraphosphate (Ap4A) HIT family hydrolase